MRKTLLATALFALCAAHAQAQEAPVADVVPTNEAPVAEAAKANATDTSADASPFSANVTIMSDYASRGISQTNERAALQAGFDYKHSSGAYLGTWGSNISWIRDAETSESSGNSLELDFYGGYAKSFGDFGVDVGLFYSGYPGHYNRRWRDDTGLKNPNTLEGYVGGSWKFLNAKVSYSFTNLFGAPDSKHSTYIEAGAAYEIGHGIKLDAHLGKQFIKGSGNDNYVDWKAGATYSVSGFDLGLHYVDTDIRHDDNADSRVIVSIGRSF